ncbi:MAG: hypothetical protein IJO52_11515 [Clostridia bacterium]|nr:hypothetical protein [Clostridia bacterium]
MKLNKTLKNLLAIFITVGTVVYIGVWFMRTFSSDVGLEYIGLSTVEQKLNIDGYIMRNEKILETSESGVVYYIADEGEKIAKNSVVANIYESESLANTQAQILEIDRKIKVLEDSRIDKNFVITDMNKIDREISEAIITMKNDALDRNFKLSAQKGDSLLTILNKRQLIASKTDSFDDKILQLEAQKTNLSHSLTGLKGSVVADVGGYFSAAIDGYESIFTTDKLKDMTVDSFEELIRNTPESITESSNAGKLITDFKWYILCQVDKSLCAELIQGENYTLIFPHSSDARIQFTLENKITQTDRATAVLVFSTLAEPDGFDFSRSQEAQIIKKSYTGLRIPKNAMRIQDNFEGVFVLKGNEVVFRRIKRIFESEGYYLADVADPTKKDGISEQEAFDGGYGYISLYDAVITEGKELYDGKVVK